MKRIFAIGLACMMLSNSLSVQAETIDGDVFSFDAIEEYEGETEEEVEEVEAPEEKEEVEEVEAVEAEESESADDSTETSFVTFDFSSLGFDNNVTEEEEEVPEKYQGYMQYDGFSYHDGSLYYYDLELNEDAMYEDVAEDGTVCYYDPLDPEFYDFFIGSDDWLSASLYSTRNSATDYTGSFDGVVYNYPSYVRGQEIYDGIDVSYYQKSINWAGLKNSGVDFVIIRAGYRSYNASGAMSEDPQFRNYIQGAYNAGIKVGVYFFSQAQNDAEAASEANKCLEIISPYKDMISLPVFMDYEYAGGSGGRLTQNHAAEKAMGLDYRAIHTSEVNTFCDTIASAGFLAGVYSNKNMLEREMSIAAIPSQYYVWMANYKTTATAYAGRLNAWQYSSTYYGFSPYIGSGNVDVDFWYGTLPGANHIVYQDYDYSVVYDKDFYYQNNEDLRKAYGYDGDKLFHHFVNYGMAEGRQGSAEFNVQAYIANNSDLKSAFGDNLKCYYDHYVNYGKSEGRKAVGLTGDYSSIFDADYYSEENPDLYAAYGNNRDKLFSHFLNYGMSEGRQGCEEFDVQYYRSRNSDLNSIYGDSLKSYYLHYMKYGKAEGRRGSNGGKYADVFDADFYYRANPDLQVSIGKNKSALRKHFINYGMAEGRRGNSTFNVKSYRRYNSDLNQVFGDNWQAYYTHYMQYGKYEGRRAA